MPETELGRSITNRPDTEAAMEEAITAATAQLSSPDSVVFAVALCSPAYRTEMVVESLRDAFGEIQILGSTTAGEFTDETVTEGGLALGLLASEDLTVETSLAEGVSDDVFESVNRAVDSLPQSGQMPGEHVAALTVHNGLAGKGEQITLVTGQLLGDIPLSGGSAGDDLELSETTVFTEAGVSTDGIAIALLASDQPFGIASNHGHTVLSERYTVTDAEENVLYELNGEPAFDVWKREVAEKTAAEYDIDIEAVSPGDDTFAELLNQFEIGIPTGTGSHKIRWPAMTDSTDGPLKFATGIPEGSEVRIMHSPRDEQIESARDSARQSIQAFDGDEIAGALVFDCVCRGLILDDDFSEAVDGIADELDAPFLGFETYGEICMPPGSASGYHNTTTSIFLIPK